MSQFPDPTYPVRVKHFLLYSSLRLLMLIVVGGAAYAAGMRGFLLILVAFVGSGVMSFFVLRGPRTQLGNDVGGFFKRINDRIDAATNAEDADPVAPTPDGVDLTSAKSTSEPGVRVQPAEQQVDAEVVEPEHNNS